MRGKAGPWWGIVLASLGGLTVARADGPNPDPRVDQGKELFARVWEPNDRRSPSGDGLGPVFNGRSCLECHHQGGAGGSGGAESNIDILSPRRAGDPDGFQAFRFSNGSSYSFQMSYGPNGFSYRMGAPTATSEVSDDPFDFAANLAELAALHPGFRTAKSVLLHRFGTDPDYRPWRERVPGRHGAIELTVSQRNPGTLLGAGAIDTIPDSVIEAAARRRHPLFPQIQGRVPRTADGKVGRFGWKGQSATLADFVREAAAHEVGLEVPGMDQAADPRSPGAAVMGLDLSDDDLDALTTYVRSLPPSKPVPAENAQAARAGKVVFKNVGCGDCHQPKLGIVDGIYSDLLLHDMSPALGDSASYGVFAVDGGGAANNPVRPDARNAPARRQEWRTPPLWGLHNSAPYLHDGRVRTIDEAIRQHGGEGTESARRYLRLSTRERAQLDAFLRTL